MKVKEFKTLIPNKMLEVVVRGNEDYDNLMPKTRQNELVIEVNDWSVSKKAQLFKDSIRQYDDEMNVAVEINGVNYRDIEVMETEDKVVICIVKTESVGLLNSNVLDNLVENAQKEIDRLIKTKAVKQLRYSNDEAKAVVVTALMNEIDKIYPNPVLVQKLRKIT